MPCPPQRGARGRSRTPADKAEAARTINEALVGSEHPSTGRQAAIIGMPVSDRGTFEGLTQFGFSGSAAYASC